MEELAPRTIVHDHHVVLLHFEELLHVDQERKGHHLIDSSFVLNQLLLAPELLFLHKFGSIELTIPSISAEKNLAESSNPDALKHLVRR